MRHSQEMSRPFGYDLTLKAAEEAHAESGAERFTDEELLEMAEAGSDGRISYIAELPRVRSKSLIWRLKDVARMAFGQDDEDDYECTNG